MTESEWHRCTDPQAMLDCLQASGQVSDRQLRLFACACVRRVWHLLGDKRSREAVEVAERYADGRVSLDELKAVGEAAIKASWAVQDEQDAAWPAEPTCGVLPAAEAAEMAAATQTDGQVWGATDGYGAWEAAIEAAAFGEVGEIQEQEQGYQAAVLRCLFGKPLHPPPTLDPRLLNPDILALAQAIYDDRKLPEGTLDPDRLAVLADTLEAAGCHDPELLGHLREEGRHVRGCWAVDLILGKN